MPQLRPQVTSANPNQIGNQILDPANFSNGAAAGYANKVLDPGNFFGGRASGPQDSSYMGSQFGDLNSYASNPYISSLGKMVSQFQPISAGGDVYQAKDMSNAPLPQYDAMQARLNQAYNTQQQTAQDAIERQFAAGGGPEGAQLKQIENLQATTDAQKSQDQLALAGEEAQTRTALQQQEAERAFESGEAQRGRQFQANEFNATMPFQEAAQVAGLGVGWSQAQEQAVNDQFNKSIADYQATHSGGLLGGGGFLGLGI